MRFAVDFSFHDPNLLNLMHTFKCAHSEWALPDINGEALIAIDPGTFSKYFFALRTNQKIGACNDLKVVLTQAYMILLDRHTSLTSDEAQRCRRKWKTDRYWVQTQNQWPKDISGTSSLPTSDRLPNALPRQQAVSFVMPGPPSVPLNQFTLSTFFDRFCGLNPETWRTPDYDIILSAYRLYVIDHYGRNTVEHIRTAYSRVRISINYCRF